MLIFRKLQILLSCFVLCLTFDAVTTTLHAANEKNYTYLALGDSVAFGLDPNLLVLKPLPTPYDFVGYPEAIADAEHLLKSKRLVNSSCPGETSDSFVTPGGRDLGCHDLGPDGEPPFKTWIGLRANYPGTQLDFATGELQANKHIDLVTLSIGANDFLLVAHDCQTASDPQACIGSQIPGMLQNLGANLATILTKIRVTAGYNGTVVLLGYYAPSVALIPVAELLNGVITSVGAQFGIVYADGFTAFQTASIPYAGDPCAAGLLIHLTPTTCDIHPTPTGRDLLAATVIAAIGGKQ
jgi:lysophospholipase L1-like esterase